MDGRAIFHTYLPQKAYDRVAIGQRVRGIGKDTTLSSSPENLFMLLI